MLGLSTGLMHSSYINDGVVAKYCSDFTQDADGWKKGNYHVGTPTIVGNINPYNDVGGSAPNSDGWLKVVYGGDHSWTQSGQIEREVAPSPFSFHGDISNPGPPYIGDVIVVKFDIYIYHDGVNDHWDGTDDVTVLIGGSWANPTSSAVFPVNTVSVMSHTHTGASFGGGRDVYVGFGVGDRPQTGATFYMKNYCATVYRQ